MQGPDLSCSLMMPSKLLGETSISLFLVIDEKEESWHWASSCSSESACGCTACPSMVVSATAMTDPQGEGGCV